MPGSGSQSSFRTIRAWDGTQDRAFEELSYQLLKADAPSGSVAIRTGNPDGGVEWYATLPDGTEWGWQAKYVRGIEALLTAMTGSVRRVAKERPQLVKLTFVISWNLATGTRGGKRKSQRQKYEAKIEAWKESIDGAAHIEFDLVQESDLLERLAMPEHQGRRWFWWAEPRFSESWFEDRLKEQADAAGEKYRPDLQVDLPIEEDLKALGCSEHTLKQFESLCRKVSLSGREVTVRPGGSDELRRHAQDVATSAKQLVDACDQTVLQAESATSCLRPLAASLDQFLADFEKAESLGRKLRIEWRKLPRDTPDRDDKKPPDDVLGYSARELKRGAEELDSWLCSSIGQVIQSRFYFLVGPAGSGKTHLFLDAVRRALEDGRPAVVLFGARFGQGNLWASVCDQLGLEPLGADVLLGAMEAAGEAAAATGRRFVILVDALNETVPADFWVMHLPALRSALSKWPHIALAVSCRDTYLDVVDDGTERQKYVVRKHPGFAGREVEATQRYFEHYGLEAPRIPLLTPEFSLPLFLRMYCESLRDSGGKVLAVGHEGRVRIFERFLQAKLTRVARRLRPAAATSFELSRAQRKVSTVIDALLDEFAATGQDGTTIEGTETLAKTALDGSLDDAAIVLGALQSEGVLNREFLYLGGKSREGFRIAFQAFSDFLILRRRLQSLNDPMADAGLRNWLRDECSWGIVEAATILMPEQYAVELPDFIGIKPRSLRWPDSNNARLRRRHGRAQNTFRSLIQLLPYRDSSAVTERTIELLNLGLRERVLSTDELFQIFFLVAPQPDNRLNADGLHRYLSKLRMPRRDAYFGVATYHGFFDESSPMSMLARWASRGPYRQYDPKVVELACVPLIWLLSSPNRFMRDWVTKALVQLLRGHLDVLRRLLVRFWKVDDPYVVQRVVVICYGALMRSSSTDVPEAKKLVKRVQDLVFTRPLRADDAARGVIEWAVARKLIKNSAIGVIKRPYGLKAPGPAPSEATLKKKYGFKENQRDEESYSTIYDSIFGMGDFGHYVVQSGVDEFSRYKYGVEYPKPDFPRARFIKSKWRVFERSLTAEQRAELKRAVDKRGADQSEPPNRMEFLIGSFSLTLTEEQAKLLDACWREPRRKFRSDYYPSDKAQRWVFQRTLSLGWKPDLFGEVDRNIGRGRGGREAHKAERWGKKYQWMAYHELLARIADNFQPYRWSSDSEEPYEGLHQLTAERDIDPSLPPIEYSNLAEHGGYIFGLPVWSSIATAVLPEQPGY